jgi:molybdate transport system ATP-binding protein
MNLEVDIRATLRSRNREFLLDVQFSISTQRVVLFGASGSGKTATLQAIAGLLRPDGGVITLNDIQLFDSRARLDVPARRRRIGYVFQDYALFPHLTVAENVAFGLGLQGHAGAMPLPDLLGTFGLADLADSLPGQISGGQRQRVALARALAPRPSVLLLDEPFAALDPPLRRRTRQELLAILERFQVPMLMISHDHEDVATFAEQLLILADGRIAASEDLRIPSDKERVVRQLRET